MTSPWQPVSVVGGRRLGSRPCTPEWLQTGREGGGKVFEAVKMFIVCIMLT